MKYISVLSLLRFFFALQVSLPGLPRHPSRFDFLHMHPSRKISKLKAISIKLTPFAYAIFV